MLDLLTVFRLRGRSASFPSALFSSVRLPRHSIQCVLFACLVATWDPAIGRAQDYLFHPSHAAFVQALPQAHAHNDYRHPRPLLDALEQGFCSVEADIFLVDGKLLVGHDLFELRPDRTLEKLYLDPLLKRYRGGGGKIYPGGQVVTLLIDFKANGAATYARLRNVLPRYSEMLSGIENGKFQQRAVQIVISGDRPKKEILADPQRRVGIDGRLSDLEDTMPADAMPMISDRWSSHFKYRGTGAMPDDERKKLEQIVRKAHAAGRRVRFWATPENETLWRTLCEAGVDHINTDQLVRLRKFLVANQPASKSATK
ncbi:MAG: phosphatidylinositol-specific phospholipase C/glycerophosphodiester phosphodiesterase family protein [Planctomycetota bacterium]